MDEYFQKLLLAGIKGVVVLILFSPLMVGPFGLSFSEYPKTIYFRVLVEVAVILWLALLALNPKYAPRITPLSGAVLAFMGVRIISSLLGLNFNRSFWGTLEAGRGLVTDLHYVAFFLLLSAIFRNKNDWIFLLRVFVFVSFFSTVAGFMQKAGIADFYGVGLVDSGRISGTLSNPVYFGSFLVITIFLGLYLAVQERQKSVKIILGIITFLNFIALALTGTRGAMAGLIFGFLILCLLCFVVVLKQNRRLRRNIFLGVLVCSAAFLALIVWRGSMLADNAVVSRFYSIFTPSSIGGRLPAWETAVKAWKDQPLLGWGSESFGFLYDKYFDADYYKFRPSYDVFNDAHNVVLNTAAENGVLGVIAYSAIFVIIFAILWRQRKHIGEVPSFILVGLFAGYFFQNLFAFNTVSTNAAFALLLGFVNTLNFSVKSYPGKEGAAQLEWPRGGAMRAGAIFLAAFVVFSFYFVNLKPALASYDFVRGFFLEARDFPGAIAHYTRGINRNTPYRRELTMLLASRDLTSLEGGQKRQWEREIIRNLADLRPFLIDNANKRDFRYLNSMELLIRAEEWTYLLGGEEEALGAAKSAARRALEFNDQWMQFYYLLGKMEFYQGNQREGEALFWKGYDFSAKGFWDLAELHKNMGVAYFRAGDKVMAAKNFKKAIDMKHTGMKNLVEKKDYGLIPERKLSMKEKDRVRLITQTDVSLFEGTALLFFQLGDEDTALEVYRKALEVYPLHGGRLKAGLEQLKQAINNKNGAL